MTYSEFRWFIYLFLMVLLYLSVGLKILIYLIDNIDSYLIDNIDSYLHKNYIKYKINVKYTKFYNYFVYTVIVLFWPLFLITLHKTL